MSLPHVSNSSSSQSVCPLWLRGSCKYGDSCMHIHADYPRQLDSPLLSAARENGENCRSKSHEDRAMGRNTNGGSGTPVHTSTDCKRAEGGQYRHNSQNLPVTLARENQESESESESFSTKTRKTPVCSYWDAGDCARGEHCQFRHGDPKIASVNVSQVTTSQQLEIALEKANKKYKRSLDKEKAAHRAREAAAQGIQHQEEVIITTLESIEQHYKERRAQFGAGDQGTCEVAERHSLPMEKAYEGYEFWLLAQEKTTYERRVAEAKENHAIALAGANKEYKRRLAEEAAAVGASEIAAREHQRQLQTLCNEEAEITEKYAVFGESSVITCRAGIDIQSVVTGFDICRIIIKNLPRDTKHKEISDILVRYGMKSSDFFVSDFRVKDMGKCREATVLVITDHGCDIAVGLDDIDVRDHTYTFEVSESLNGSSNGSFMGSWPRNVLSIGWRIANTTIIATYKNTAEAERKAKELNEKVCKGQRIRAEKNQLRAPSIKLTGFPLGTLEDQEIRTFTGTTNIITIDPKSCTLEESLAMLLNHLQTFPNVETTFHNFTEPVNGKARIKAYFESWEDAKRAHDSLDGKQLNLKSPKFHSSLPSAMQYKTIITLQQYEAQKGKWDALSESMTGSDALAHVQINTMEDRKKVLICVLGKDKKAVGLLKVRVEGMAAGEKLDSHFWHPSFLEPDGKAFFERLYKDKKVYVRIDLKFRVLRLYGESKAIKEVRQKIKEEVNRLARLETTIALDQKSIGFFMRQGLGRLQELIGEENVVLSIVPGQCEITIKGGEEERHHLNRLIRESKAAPIMEKIHPEKDEKVNCPVCFDDVSHPEQLGCGHIYCSGCLSHYLASAPEAKTFPLVCLGDETACKIPISLPLIRRFMTPQAFQALVEAAFRSYLEQHSQELKYCTTPDCQQIYRHSSEARILQCPSCFSSICSACDDEPHERLTCQERRNQKNPSLQERLFNEWANENGKRCPKCRSVIEKIDGCNHMTCRCGAHFCWKCGKNFGANEIYQHMTDAHGGAYAHD